MKKQTLLLMMLCASGTVFSTGGGWLYNSGQPEQDRAQARVIQASAPVDIPASSQVDSLAGSPLQPSTPEEAKRWAEENPEEARRSLTLVSLLSQARTQLQKSQENSPS